ncbi:zinc-binding alcohol dehydrogenase family protein [Xanthomonas hyacinthi]|nr:zinc-binding dehydrogenase [Xanthomonas hyacinthi]KLD79017.1 hypothetical protein Y886_07015 [Xanthomonas hyacinthi DSM 19077]
MRAVEMAHTGKPDVLRVVERDIPTIKPGHLLVKVGACGVNYADVVRRSGKPYPVPTPCPFILGAEIAGVVMAVGDGVDRWAEGDTLVALMDHGGYAEYALVSADAAMPVPSDLLPEIAAALLLQGMTALVMLDHVGRLSSGQSVFIDGAAGGLGGIASQIARIFGAADIVGGVSTPGKFAEARERGFTDVVDYTAPQWVDAARDTVGGRGFDLVLHMRGGSAFVDSMKLLAPGGRLILYGQASGEPMPIDATIVLGLVPGVAPNTGILGCYLPGYMQDAAFCEAQIKRLIEWVTSGAVSIKISQTLPLEQAAEAHRLIESRTSTGKIILKP